MEIKLTKKQVCVSVLIFLLNAIVILATAILMEELNILIANLRGNPVVYESVLDFIIINWQRAVFIVASVLFLLSLTYGYLYFESRKILAKPSKQVEIFLLLELSFVFSFLVSSFINPNARPFGFFAIMCATLIGRKEAMFLNVIDALLVFIMDINISLLDSAAISMWQYSACLLISFCAGTLVVFVSHRIKTRLQSILIVFLLLIPIGLIIGVMEILPMGAENFQWELLGYGGVGAVFAMLAYMLLLPVFELIFAELTTFRLREITAPNAPLIKKLKEEAPGTYNHSIVVAQLAEACAIEIGEDGEFARAAAYYHDVGKLKNPKMFTENQSDHNVHNELSPELSADIIRSHARDGSKLIKKQHLPEFLADVAVQHHGTLPIKYFYAKALKMSDGEVLLSNFSYPGPLPKTRIAAIIMIADAAEAASRSISDRSAANIEKLVGTLIVERINLDQFSDCNITMRDLTIISRTIAQSLSGVYHNRIAYPKLKITKNK